MDDKEYHKQASAKHYQENKERYQERDRKRKLAVRRWFVEYKSQLSCVKCGESHPACIVFHHRDPEQKDVEISVAISNRWSPSRILVEIEKCDVLCANCHHKHHWDVDDNKVQRTFLKECIPE